MLAEFNLFRVLGITRDELSHSAFLAWLLNPRQTHGLGDYVLRRFLIEAAAEARSRGMSTISPVDVDAWRFLDVEVVTERHNIDILLVGRSDGFVCPIENKIGTGEHSDQLRRYLATVESAHPALTPFPILLSPGGNSPVDESDALRWIPCSYSQVGVLVRRILEARGSTIGPNVRSFVEQYENTLRRHVMGSADNIDELAYKLYEKHRAAFNFIDRVKSTPGSLHLETIDQWVAECAPLLQPSVHHPRIRRYSSPDLDGIAELRRATSWNGSDRLLLFEFSHNAKKRLLDLNMVVGPGDASTRERIFSRAKKVGHPFRQFKKTTRFMHVSRRHILTPRNYHPIDLEQTKEAALRGIADWYKTDYAPLVNAIRSEFGLDSSSQP